jgi:adenine/guanine phosphoribosyltransferase-like PRPP-binding protein
VTTTAPPSQLLRIECIKRHIRSVPDWWKPGVRLRDIARLLSNARALRALIDEFATAISVCARPRSRA